MLIQAGKQLKGENPLNDRQRDQVSQWQPVLPTY